MNSGLLISLIPLFTYLGLRRDPLCRPVAVLEPEVDLGLADLLVRLEGDVPADHVVEEDSQGPDGGGIAVILTEQDPLGGSVDAGAWNQKDIKIRCVERLFKPIF